MVRNLILCLIVVVLGVFFFFQDSKQETYDHENNDVEEDGAISNSLVNSAELVINTHQTNKNNKVKTLSNDVSMSVSDTDRETTGAIEKGSSVVNANRNIQIDSFEAFSRNGNLSETFMSEGYDYEWSRSARHDIRNVFYDSETGDNKFPMIQVFDYDCKTSMCRISMSSLEEGVESSARTEAMMIRELSQLGSINDGPGRALKIVKNHDNQEFVIYLSRSYEKTRAESR